MEIIVNSAADKGQGELTAGEMTLRAAIVKANAERDQSVTIKFDPSIFNAPKTIEAPNTETAFLISGNVQIIGPESPLTIRGRGLGPVFWIDSGTFPQYPNKGDGSRGFTPIVVPGNDKKVRIENLLITGGKKYGGILNSEDLTLENVKIFGNKADFDAAKKPEKFPWGDPTQNNPAPYIPNRLPVGAGVTSVNGDLTISNSEISDNLGENARGGGVLAYQIAETLSIVKNQSVNITGSKIFGNSIKTSIDSNQLLDDQPNGGGMLSLADYTNIDNTAIFNNHSTYGGGGLATAANGRGLSSGKVEIVNSTIYSNTANVRGGGLLGMINLSGSNIYDNQASKQADLADVAGGYFAVELDADPETPGEQKMIHFIAGGEGLAMTSDGFNVIGNAGQKNRANSGTSSILPVVYDPTKAPLLVAIPTTPLTSNFWPQLGERPDALDIAGHTEQPLEALGVGTQTDAAGNTEIGLEASSQLIDAGDPELEIDTSLGNDRDANGRPRQKGLVVDVGGVEFATEVALTSDRPQMIEGETTTFTVSRDPVDFGDLTVGLRLKTTAQPTDFVLRSASGEAIAPDADGLFTVTIPDGETAIAFEVVAIEDDEKEIREYFDFEVLQSVFYERVSGKEQLEVELKYSDLTPGTVVTNINDSGEGSLREAIRIANETPGNDVIVFDFEDPSLGDQATITLTGGSLNITDGVFIHGPRDQKVTIARDPNAAPFRIFTIDDGDANVDQTVKLENLTITQGLAGDRGGGIYNAENLEIRRSKIVKNQVGFSAITGNSAEGGGIFNLGFLKIFQSSIADNQASFLDPLIIGNNGNGGGISNRFLGVLDIENSSVMRNSTSHFGGGIFNDNNVSGVDDLGFSVRVVNSTISKNEVEINNGGGIWNSGNSEILNTTISENRANSYGGGVAQEGGQLKLGSTVISGNQAGLDNSVNDIGGNLDSTILDDGNNAIGIGNGFATAFPILWSGNGHYYQLVHTSNRINWEAARFQAEEMGGYLATITSPSENNFVQSLISYPESAAILNLRGGPWIGGFQAAESPEPGGNWQWINGENFGDYTNWNPGEPNNLGPGGVAENYLQIDASSGRWNDAISFVGQEAIAPSSFIVEFNDLTPSGQIGSTTSPLHSEFGIDTLQEDISGLESHALLSGSSLIDQGNNPLNLKTEQMGEEFRREVGNGVDVGAREFGSDSPIAIPDFSNLELINQGQIRQGNVIPNDISPVDQALKISAVDGDSNKIGQPTSTFDLKQQPMGLVRVDKDGNYYFDPNGDFDFLDEGEETQVQFTYTISDEENRTDTTTVTVTVRGSNDVPTDIVLNEIQKDTGIVAIAQPSVPGSDTAWMVQNQPDGFIGWLNVLDPDNGDNENFANFTFEISLPTADTVPFEIQRDPTTQKPYLKLKANANIDTSRGTVHQNLAITATDPAGLSTTEVFSFAIVDPKKIALNDPPTSAPTHFSLNENTTYFFKPDDFPFEDRNPDDTLQSIEIIGRPTQGELILAKDLGNRQIERIRSVGLGERIGLDQMIGGSSSEKLAFQPYSNEHGIVSDTHPDRFPYDGLLFRVSDGKDVSQLEYLMIADVLPVNTPPVVLSGQEFTISRELPVTTPVGTVVGQDWDGGTTMAGWAINPDSNPDVDGDGIPAFVIDPDTGEITLLDPDDLAGHINEIVLDVTVQDEEFTSDSQPVTIYIQDVPLNHPPTTENHGISISGGQIYHFNGDEFSFNDLDLTDSLHAIQIIAWPSLGDVFIDDNGDGIFDPNEKVSMHQDIPAADITQLKFAPDSLTSGGGYSTEIGFVVSDGQNYSQPAKITVTVNGLPIAPAPAPITGSWKSDILTGTDQDDIIQGNQGRDTLTGGAGNDIFRYTRALEFADVIVDFELGSDRIDLSAVLTEIGYTGSDPLGDGYITAKTTPMGKTYLQLDVDGTGPLHAIDIAEMVGVSPTDLNNPAHFIV